MSNEAIDTGRFVSISSGCTDNGWTKWKVFDRLKGEWIAGGLSTRRIDPQIQAKIDAIADKNRAQRARRHRFFGL